MENHQSADWQVTSSGVAVGYSACVDCLLAQNGLYNNIQSFHTICGTPCIMSAIDSAAK